MSDMHKAHNYNNVARALVEQAEVVSKMRSAMAVIESYADNAQGYITTEAMRERLEQIREMAQDMKDFGL